MLIRSNNGRDPKRHAGGSLGPGDVTWFRRAGRWMDAGLSACCLVTMFVRTGVVKSCPPDMAGHVPDMIPDIQTCVIEEKMRSGRPDILAGHGAKSYKIITYIVFGASGHPLCPDMHGCPVGAPRTTSVPVLKPARDHTDKRVVSGAKSKRNTNAVPHSHQPRSV